MNIHLSGDCLKRVYCSQQVAQIIWIPNREAMSKAGL